MKTAIIGQGKTGREVLQFLQSSLVEVLDSHEPILVNKLREFDVIIVLIPGLKFLELLPTLLNSRVPVVAGLTEVTLPSYMEVALAEAKTRWVIASSFSLGMIVMHEAIRALKHADRLFDSVNFQIREIHDTSKHDTPTTTALNWRSWLNKPCEISSERENGEVGTHQLVIKTPDEEILLSHKALNRKIFARGAVWAAHRLVEDKNLPYGLIRFEDLTRNLIDS